MQRQEAVFGLAEQYQDRLGAEWAGAYIDHADAGKLVVQTGSAAATQQATAAALPADADVDVAVDVEIRTVRHTVAELDRAGREAMARVQGPGSDAAMITNLVEELFGRRVAVAAVVMSFPPLTEPTDGHRPAVVSPG